MSQAARDIAVQLIRWQPPQLADLEQMWDQGSEDQLATIIALVIDVCGIGHDGDLEQVTLQEVHQAMSTALSRPDLQPGMSQWVDVATRIVFLHCDAVAQQGSQQRSPSDFSLGGRLRQLSDPAASPTSVRPSSGGPGTDELVDFAMNVRSNVAMVGGEPVIILGHVGRMRTVNAATVEDIDWLGSRFLQYGAKVVPLSPLGQPQFPRHPAPGWEARLAGTELVVTADGDLIYDGGLFPDRAWIDQATEHVAVFRGVNIVHCPPGSLNRLEDILFGGEALAVRAAMTLGQ